MKLGFNRIRVLAVSKDWGSGVPVLHLVAVKIKPSTSWGEYANMTISVEDAQEQGRMEIGQY